MKTNQSISLRWRIAAVLLLLLWGVSGAFAQVNITNLATDYAAKKISFTVTWTAAPYNNQIWVIVDYMKVDNTTTAGSWSRATVTAVSKTAGTGTATTATGNLGFWLTTSGSSGSATITATLSLASGVTQFHCCAYALNYPPQAVIKAAGGYDLKGTPPFKVNGTTLAAAATTYGAGTCITSLSDATNNPAGIVPALPVVSSVTASTPCAGGSATLNATLSGSTTTAMTYSWNIGGSTSTTTGNAKTTQALTANTTYTVTVRNANGCVSAAKNGTITVNALPVVSSVAASTPCAGGSATLNATMSGGTTSAMTYSWNIGGTASTTSGNTKTSQALTANTTYTVTVTNATGCVSEAQAGPITVHTAVGSATISGNSSNTCPDYTVTLSATANGATSFTWYRNGSQVQTGAASYYTVASAGSYSVSGLNANCSGTSSTGKVITINACSEVKGCSGFTLLQTSISFDGREDWDTATNYCASRGARLPTEYEATCMCEKRGIIAGGYVVGGKYWLAKGDEVGWVYSMYDQLYCNAYKGTIPDQCYFRCVK